MTQARTNVFLLWNHNSLHLNYVKWNTYRSNLQEVIIIPWKDNTVHIVNSPILSQSLRQQTVQKVVRTQLPSVLQG